MPQVDLRPLFTPTSQQISRTPPSETETGPTASPPKRSIRITGEQITNIGFVIAACLGAIISAAFLFKGGEVFQEVAAWPRELFYGRPSPAPHTTAANNGPVSADGSIQSSPSPAQTGDPFSPTSKLLNLNPVPALPRPNRNSSGAPFSSPSNFDRLNMMSPPSDALSRGLTQATTSPAAQTTSSAIGNAVAAPQTAATAAADAKGALKSTTQKMSSAKISSARGLSKVSAKRSTASAKGTAAHSSLSSSASAKTETSIGSMIPRTTSSGAAQAANIQSAGGMGHGIGSMGARGSAGLGSGFGGGGHSFGRAGGR